MGCTSEKQVRGGVHFRKAGERWGDVDYPSTLLVLLSIPPPSSPPLLLPPPSTHLPPLPPPLPCLSCDAAFDPSLCPPDCPRPCVRICPAAAIHMPHPSPAVSPASDMPRRHVDTSAATPSVAAIGSQEGVQPDRCYGCGRCVPVCPHGLIGTLPRSANRFPQSVSEWRI